VKGFIYFLAFSLLLLAGFITYNIIYPSDGMIVRQNGKWIVVEHNNTQK